MRIVRPRKGSKAGTISIVLTASVALLLLIARQAFHEEPMEPAFRRSLADVELDWRCDAGHLFRASGQIGARQCWTCGRPAFVVTRYACPQHGEFEVAVEFGLSDGGNPVPTRLRVDRGLWTPEEQGAACPRCRRAMSRLVEEPLDKLKPRKP